MTVPTALTAKSVRTPPTLRAPITLLLAFALLLGSCAREAGTGTSHPNQPDEGMDVLEIIPFRLTDQSNNEVTESVFEGRYSVVDFIFTHCPFICPNMAIEMDRLSRELSGRDVHFISISVDPERDTPERLTEYASRYTDDFERWTFLTGDRETIWTLLNDGLKFHIAEDPSVKVTLPGGGQMSNIQHPGALLLIGPDKRVLGMYDHRYPEDMQALQDRLRAIAPAR